MTSQVHPDSALPSDPNYGAQFDTTEQQYASLARSNASQISKDAAAAAPTCPWCEKNELAPITTDDTTNYQCGECLNFSHAAAPSIQSGLREILASAQANKNAYIIELASSMLSAGAVAKTEQAPTWRGSLAQVIMDIPLPEESNKYQHGFVDAKQAILKALRDAGFDWLQAGAAGAGSEQARSMQEPVAVAGLKSLQRYGMGRIGDLEKMPDGEAYLIADVERLFAAPVPQEAKQSGAQGHGK